MLKNKLKELVLKHLAELLDEESASGDAGGYLGIKAFKPKYEATDKVFNRNPARPKTKQDTDSPTGFESMPDSAKIYIKGGFRTIKPKERIDAKDLWKGQHLEERMAILTPKAFRKIKKQHETSKSGHEDLPNPDKYFELVKFKIVEPKEEQLNEISTTVNYKPYVVKDSNNPNFLKIFIKYPTGEGFTTALGQRTMSGEERDYGVKKAMQIGQAIALKLESSYNLEDIDVFDNEDGKVIVFAVSDDFINTPKPQINEVRYSQFKNETKNRTPQQQLHEGVKKIQRNLDEINKLVEFVTRMKTELKGDADSINYLKRTHNSLFKINERIQEINNKIKGLTE
jgi:hypothetical protein